tara:strand:- start:21 stop:197 length:177 start_codon:yes stop_codon:yes gene_type:complete
MIAVIFAVIAVNMFFVVKFAANKCLLVVKRIWNKVDHKRKNKYKVEEIESDKLNEKED